MASTVILKPRASYAIRLRGIRTRGFVPFAIVRRTDSMVDHVEFGTAAGTWIGAHLSGGWQERPADYCTPVYERYYELPLANAAEQDEWEAHLRSQIGTKYNTLAIVGLALGMRNLFGFGLTSLHRKICSQGVTDNMIWKRGAAGWLNIENSLDYTVTPRECLLAPCLVGHLVRKVG